MTEQGAGSQTFWTRLFEPAKNKPHFTAVSQGHVFFGVVLCLFWMEIGTFIATSQAKAEGALTNLFVCFMLLVNILSSQFNWNKIGTVIFRLASYLAVLAVFARLYFYNP